jgi:hypothetical protein
MLARFGAVLYRTRWMVLIAALVLVASAASFGFGVFNSLKTGGFTPGKRVLESTGSARHKVSQLVGRCDHTYAQQYAAC